MLSEIDFQPLSGIRALTLATNDEPLLIAGVATIALEILEDAPEVTTILMRLQPSQSSS